jgi:hypothetical protein
MGYVSRLLEKVEKFVGLRLVWLHVFGMMTVEKLE